MKCSLQVNFNEPISMLQRLSEDLEYHELLDKASKCQSSLEQMCYVAAFSVSSYSTTVHRTGKPFNPLLGETYELDRRRESGYRSLCEQVRRKIGLWKSGVVNGSETEQRVTVRKDDLKNSVGSALKEHLTSLFICIWWKTCQQGLALMSVIYQKKENSPSVCILAISTITTHRWGQLPAQQVHTNRGSHILIKIKITDQHSCSHQRKQANSVLIQIT